MGRSCSHGNKTLVGAHTWTAGAVPGLCTKGELRERTREDGSPLELEAKKRVVRDGEPESLAKFNYSLGVDSVVLRILEPVKKGKEV